MVNLLVPRVTARLAVLGAGGMGKTSVALALLNDSRVIEDYRGGRLFISCEALIDADAMVVSLAKILGLSPSGDLLTAVVTHLENIPRVILVIDNLETVWLKDGGQITAVDELLGRLAQIPTLSLVITCRGTHLPQSVQWSNGDAARLDPFSLKAALQTFQDSSGFQLEGNDEQVARKLLNAVDRMPLAVSLLGQLIRRGNSVLDLFERWTRKRTSLLRTHDAGRINNVGISIELSIILLCAADERGEALRLLSLCSALPDGLSQYVLQKLRPQFDDIDRARDNVIGYSLANLGVDRTLRTLSPVRHYVLERYPAAPGHHAALCSIYFDIAKLLPNSMDEDLEKRAAAFAPEINNLSSLLLSVINRPSQQIVSAVLQLTGFLDRYQPNITVVKALLVHLEPHPTWKADCLRNIGCSQSSSSDWGASIESLATASRLYLKVGNRLQAARCIRRSAEPHRLMGKYDQAEVLLRRAIKITRKLENAEEEATCWLDLGVLMMSTTDYPAALQHLTVARQAFRALGRTVSAFLCTEHIGTVYLNQGHLDRAASELEAACSAFVAMGFQNRIAQSTRHLGMVRRFQCQLDLAEQLLERSETMSRNQGDRVSLAACSQQFGYLRLHQGRPAEALTRFETAHRVFAELGVQKNAEGCRQEMDQLRLRS